MVNKTLFQSSNDCRAITLYNLLNLKAITYKYRFYFF